MIQEKNELRYIQRWDPELNSGPTRGWQVKLWWNKRLFSGSFTDAQYGGKQRALEAAKRYRDALEAEYGRMNERLIAETARRVSNSGILGIRRVTSKASSLFHVGKLNVSCPAMR